MGDRCYLSLEICGQIKTIEALNEIAEEISKDFGLDKAGIYKEITDADRENRNANFIDDGCNYGNTDDVETMLKRYGIAYRIDQGAGSEYPSQYRSWRPGDQHTAMVNDYDGDPIIPVAELVRISKAIFPAQEIQQLLQEIDRATGKDLSTFSLSDEVRGWMIIGGHLLEREKINE